jgi:opacity protein-like surface antigen
MRFLLCFFCFFANIFAVGNYKSVNQKWEVKGLEPKELTLEEEGTREITIKKRETYKAGDGREISYLADRNDDFYILLGYNNSLKTRLSNSLFKENASLGFAKPIIDRRFGGELFFGKNFNQFALEFGVDYNMVYVDFPAPSVAKAGIHTIAPSLRLIYSFPINDFAFYFGGGFGIAIVDFVKGDKYKAKYSPQFGFLTGVSYDFNEYLDFFFGYKFLHTKSNKFLLEEEYTTGTSSHNLNFGVKIKF